MINTSTLDKLGHVIMVGAYIAYGHALGRCAGLRVGKVLAITKVRGRWESEGIHFRVIGVEDDYVGGVLEKSGLPHYQLRLCERVGTLQFAERIIVLDAERVPQAYKELLDGYVRK